MTPYSKIFENFTQKIQDYTINNLFKTDINKFESYCLQFLRSARTKFKQCSKDLSNFSDTDMQFLIDLDESEIEILACLTAIEWLEREIKNINDMRLGLNDSDFKRYQEANNFKQKESLRNNMHETVDKLIVEYTWYNPNYSPFGK